MRPIEVVNAPLRPDRVEGPRVLDRARNKHMRRTRMRNEITRRVFLPHEERAPIAIHVFVDPMRSTQSACITRHRAHVATITKHGLGTIGRDARHDVEERVRETLTQMRGQPGKRDMLFSVVKCEQGLGDRERHA